MTPALLVLHAVRLAGFGTTQAVAERAQLDVGTTELYAETLQDAGLVERFTFGAEAGWVLTEAGRDHDTATVQADVPRAGATALLIEAADRFEAINARFVEVVTAWQLRADDADDAAKAVAVVAALDRLTRDVDAILAPVAAVLPRFGRYPEQLRAAVERAHAGQVEWVAGVGRLSAHTVWAELHQDLLTSLGRERG